MKTALFFLPFFICMALPKQACAQRYTINSFGLQGHVLLPKKTFDGGIFWNNHNYRRTVVEALYAERVVQRNESKLSFKDYLASLSYQWNIVHCWGHGINLNASAGINVGFRNLKTDFLAPGVEPAVTSDLLYGGFGATEIQVYILQGLSAIGEIRLKWIGLGVHEPVLLTYAAGLRYEFF